MLAGLLAQQLRSSPHLLNVVLHRLAEQRKANVLLFVDQLEELATLVAEEQVAQDEKRPVGEEIGPVLSLGSSCPCINGNNGVVLIILAIEHKIYGKFFYFFFNCLYLLGDFFYGIGI